MKEQVLFMKRTLKTKKTLLMFSKIIILNCRFQYTEETLDILDEKFEKIDLIVIDMQEDPFVILKVLRQLKDK